MACLYNRVQAHMSQASFQHRQTAARTKLIPASQHHRSSSSFSSLLQHQHGGIMLLLRAAPMAYAKVDKVDAEEARHWKAQFLIHKVLEDGPTRRRRRRPAAAAAAALSRDGGCRVARAARIGVRLKRLRIAVRSIRLRLYRSVQKHLKNLTRLAHGDRRRA